VKKALLLSGATLALLSQGVCADYLKGSYEARLSYRDHFNSHGSRLETVAGIIRQDRANYHRYHRRDAEDTWDRFFDSKENRATMERMLSRGYITRSARRAILYGTPLVRVKIYDGGRYDYVKVQILDEGSGRRSSVE